MIIYVIFVIRRTVCMYVSTKGLVSSSLLGAVIPEIQVDVENESKKNMDRIFIFDCLLLKWFCVLKFVVLLEQT